MKLSVIICVYNTKKEYLSACLKSITRSTISDLTEGYEICMIDDGSSLDYSDLVEEFGIKYTKTDNRGILAARKLGAQLAEGEYSIYCDSDDSITFNYYLPMIEKAEEAHADIVINDWAFHTERIKYVCKNDSTVKGKIDVSGEDCLLEFVKNEGREHSYYVLWNKLYRTELLRKALLSLEEAGMPERSSFSEDAAINFFCWKEAKKVVNVHTGYYLYRIHDGQTVNVISEKKLLSHVQDMSRTLSLMENAIGNNPHKDEIISHLKEWKKLMSRSHYAHAKAGGYTALYPIIKEEYEVDSLKMPRLSDSSAYVGNTLLGENFDEVDPILRELWYSCEPQLVAVGKQSQYVHQALKEMQKKGKIIPAKKRDADVIIPNIKNKFILRLIHNGLIYRLGLLLFKKGSKLRMLLKKLV